MIRRAYLSVKRRKTKTIIIFLFLFIISTLVLSTISIKNATKKSMDVARKSLSTEVTLSMDMEKLRENFKKDDSSTSTDEDKKEQLSQMHEKMSENSATMADINKLKDSKYLCDLKYTFDVQGEEESFELYSSSSTENSNDNNQNNNGGGPEGKMLANNNLQIEAINTFKLLDEYLDKTVTLESGEAFDENDEDVAIISYELATANNLSVGDKIKIKDSSDNSHELTIKGIYQNSESMGFNNNYNKIYVNISTGEKFLSSEEYNDGNYTIKSAVFYLNDPDNCDKFISEAKKLITDLEDRNLKLDIDTQTYEQMTSSIKNVANLSNIILIVVIAASIIVITLITINSLKDRNYELGVLLSLGEKKLKIIGQFILELLIISTVSFLLAIASSKIISQKLADTIISTQSKADEKMMQGPGGDRGNGMKATKNSNEIKSVNVDVNGKNICYLFLIGYGIIFISNVIPSIKILNSDPKDILSRKE